MKNILKIKHHLIAFITLCFVFLPVVPALAANLFFEGNAKTLVNGQEFSVGVYVNTATDSLNAAEGIITFPINLLKVKEIRDGNSIINFWIDRPSVKQSGTIDFSGIIPGGYQSPRGLLFSIIFQASAIGSGSIAADKVVLLKNDGQGTPASATVSPLSLSVEKSNSENIPIPIVEKIVDRDPPEEFKPDIFQSPDVFDGKWFLVFVAQDKGSGIDHYEVSEGGKESFVIAESPYILESQNLEKEIYVKAVDKNGNERVEVFYPPLFDVSAQPLLFRNRIVNIVFMILGILIIGNITCVTVFLRKKRKHK